MTLRSKQWLMDQRKQKKDKMTIKETSVKKIFEVKKVVSKADSQPVSKKGSKKQFQSP